MRKMDKSNLSAFFAAVSEKYPLYMPVDTENGAVFERYEEGKALSEALNTNKSIKDFFFPQTENLMDFKVEGKTIEVIDTREECEDFILFGVRGCDVKAMEVLDRVFLVEPIDTYYQNRRDHGIIFSMACNKPLETCFCQTFSIDASAPEGDVVCYMTEDALLMDAKTQKGAAVLAQLDDITQEADASAADEQKELIQSRLGKLPLKDLSADAFGNGKTSTFFDAPEWKELSQACLGCGTCTFVCPTCQCYDIRDFDTGHGVKRMRCWDSCMYSDFTKMAHGNPRLTQLERFRQRFMHKLVYYPTNNNGLFSCVGCGRCLAKCPINMNIVKVMKKLGGNNHGNA